MTTFDQTQRWNEQLREVRSRVSGVGVPAHADLRTRAGADIFDAMGRGVLPMPPICETLDFWPVEWESGRMVFQGAPSPAHYNPLGSVHGGWIAAILDSAVGCAVHSTLPAGTGYTTVELKINYVRAVTLESGPLRAEGKVIHVGKQLATAEGRLHDARGRLYAHASTTCLVFAMSERAS